MDQQILKLLEQVSPKNPMQYLRGISADYSLEKLNQAISCCDTCSCFNKRKSYPFGNPRGSIMIIGENISTEQVLSDNKQMDFYPFVNSAGEELLSDVLDLYKVNRDELFFINTVNCCTFKDPESGNLETRTPKKSETLACKTFVNYALDIVNPCGILLLGSVAMNLWHLDSITQSRGKFIFANRIPAMPTYHPDFFTRAKKFKNKDQIADLKNEFVDDIGNFFKYFYEKYPESNIFTDDPSEALSEIEV